MSKILEKTIDSVQDFVNFIDKKKMEKENSAIKVDFLFRGQRRIEPLRNLSIEMRQIIYLFKLHYL